ncbi:MAG: hemin-degrading factor [Nitrosopumilus sp.]|nr:hemin-degrading factor [Nitrosopumilus sp.]
MLLELLSDLVKIDDVLFIVKNNGAVSEVKGPLSIRQKEKWITIGDNDGPAHLHIDSEMIKSAEFVEEEKPERTSYSVRFFDENGDRIVAVFFTKMYDNSQKLISDRQIIYDQLKQKFTSKIQF